MAKPKKKPDAEAPGMNDEQRQALYHIHLQACRDQEVILTSAMEGLKAIRKVRTQVRNLARADGFPLVKIDDILKKEGLSQKDLQAEAELFRWMDQMAGMPVGGQTDLFAATPVEVKDALDHEADGYRAGMRASEPKPPETCPPRFHQDWLKGWHAGQERNAWAMSERGTITDRRTDIGHSAVELQPEPEDEPEPDADLDAAQKEAETSWAEPTEAEQSVQQQAAA